MQDLYAGHAKEPAEDAGMLHHSDHCAQRRAGLGVQQHGHVLGDEAAQPHLEVLYRKCEGTNDKVRRYRNPLKSNKWKKFGYFE